MPEASGPAALRRWFTKAVDARAERTRADIAAAAAKGPTGQQKSSTVPELAGLPGGVPSWSYFMPTEREQTPAWQGRQRIETVQAMLNDTQVASLRQAVRLPVHRYRIMLDPLNCDAVAADLVASDLDVPLKDAPDEQRPGRRAGRFSQRQHLDRAMDALDYGHAVFEHAGRLDAAGYWRLTDLPPVPQWTIDDPNSWEIDRHGHLVKVIQHGCTPPVELPVDHLVVFTWQGAPGDPRGRSLLRPLYGAWMLRDRTLRVMGMSDERTGMGIPVGAVSPGSVGAKEAMERLLAGLAAGEDTNLVLETDKPVGDSLMLMGVTGQTPDLAGHLRYYDESMARAMLAMLLQLNQGGKGGSYALGSTFDDLLADFHDAVVDWYCDKMTQQIVEPWIDRNRGPDAEAPRLVWARREDEEETDDEPVEDPETEPAIDGDAVELDDATPQLPAPTAARRRSPPDAGLARRQRAVRSSFATVAGRDLRRDPSAFELAASTDFALLEAEHVAARQDLAAVLLRDRDELADVAVNAVAAMRDVDPLTLGGVLAPVLAEHAASMDSTPLVTMLTATADAGVAQVLGEAARQGVVFDASVDYAERAEAEAREMLRRMASQVTESAAAAARTSVPPTQARRGLLARLVRSAQFAEGEADVVAAQLASLPPANAERAAAGATSRATNSGRVAAMEAGPTSAVVASELLDDATCPPCEEIDGTEYATVEEALDDYPGGGYVGCEGMDACRGTLVATFDTESPAAA